MIKMGKKANWCNYDLKPHVENVVSDPAEHLAINIWSSSAWNVIGLKPCERSAEGLRGDLKRGQFDAIATNHQTKSGIAI